MVINLSATTAFVVKAAPVGVTTTILLDKNKTKEQNFNLIKSQCKSFWFFGKNYKIFKAAKRLLG